MECPHCNEPLSSFQCSACGKEVPENSLFCLFCGNSLDPPDSEPGPDEDDFEASDFDNRELCPDGTCTGIIENRRCTECGKSL